MTSRAHRGTIDGDGRAPAGAQGLPPGDPGDYGAGWDRSERPRGGVRRPDGTLRLREDDASEPDRRDRPPDFGVGAGGRDRRRAALGERPRPVAQPEHRLHLPVLQPDPGADRGRERRAAAPAHRVGAEGSPRTRGHGVESRQAGRSGVPLPPAALRRPGAARRDRARDRGRPQSAGGRRADRRSGRPQRRGDPGADGDAQPGVPQNDRHGDPRPARLAAGPHPEASRQGRAAGGSMKFLPYILKHLRRSWVRTASTVLAMSVCIFLFCTLRTFVEAVTWNLQSAKSSLLVSRHAVSLVFNLPLAYKERIAALPRVRGVPATNWFGWDH